MKLKKHLADRILYKLLSALGFPPQNIRHQEYIVPCRYYYNFGNIVKAVPLSHQERKKRKHAYILAKDEDATVEQLITIENGCESCPFNDHLPCPPNNVTENGCCICQTHRFVIVDKV